MFLSVSLIFQHTLVCVPTMVTIPNSIVQQSQSHQSNSTFPLALSSSSNSNFATLKDGIKTTIAKPTTTIQQQQSQQNINKMQGIVFNTIQLQQSQLQAKLQRQSSQTNPLTTRTIQQRTHTIQLAQAPPPAIVHQGEKLSDVSYYIHKTLLIFSGEKRGHQKVVNFLFHQSVRLLFENRRKNRYFYVFYI